MMEFILKAIVTRKIEVVVEAEDEIDIRAGNFEQIGEEELDTIDFEIISIRALE